MKEQQHLQTTGTFGPVLEERLFTEDEKIVLRHFFTNIDKNIYAATDAMPNALWALLEGGYSRSQLSMRMRFLNIFEEMQQEYTKGILPEEDYISIEEFSRQIQSGSTLNLGFFLSRAEKFMRKWAVQYGHDSLKDSDNVRFAIENITQFAAKIIEEARLGAYQEKSTRYVEFSRKSLAVPTDLADFAEEITTWNNTLMDNYETCRQIATTFVQSRLDPNTFANPAAYQRTVAAKVFDMVRYFIPATMLTSLGVVWPTREAERHITRLISDPRQEIRAIGQALKEEGKKVSPGLLSHINVNTYQQHRTQALHNLHTTHSTPPRKEQNGRQPDAVQLVDCTQDIEERIAALILFETDKNALGFTHHFNRCKQDKKLVENVFEAYFSNRSQFDAFPVGAEAGTLSFEITLDFGAWRDLQRHRRNTSVITGFTASLGIEYPEYVQDEPALNQFKERMETCAKKTKDLHEKIRASHPHHAEYIIMFANKQRFYWQMDPRQFVYVVELRTTPAGHHSYRTIVQQMFTAAAPRLPSLSKYIRANMGDGEEGRKKQEERTVEKLKALGGDLKRTS